MLTFAPCILIHHVFSFQNAFSFIMHLYPYHHAFSSIMHERCSFASHKHQPRHCCRLHHSFTMHFRSTTTWCAIAALKHMTQSTEQRPRLAKSGPWLSSTFTPQQHWAPLLHLCSTELLFCTTEGMSFTVNLHYSSTELLFLHHWINGLYCAFALQQHWAPHLRYIITELHIFTTECTIAQLHHSNTELFIGTTPALCFVRALQQHWTPLCNTPAQCFTFAHIGTQLCITAALCFKFSPQQHWALHLHNFNAVIHFCTTAALKSSFSPCTEALSSTFSPCTEACTELHIFTMHRSMHWAPHFHHAQKHALSSTFTTQHHGASQGHLRKTDGQS